MSGPRLDDVELVPGTERDRSFVWKVDGVAVDFSATAYTFTVRIAERGSTTDLAISEITAASTSASGVVTVSFDTDGTSQLTAGVSYLVQIWGTRDSDGDEIGPAEFYIHAKARIGANL